MSSHRIYEEKHDIDTDNTKNFYDQRAKNIGNMSSPYVAVLLGDQDPQHAVDWNTFEKTFILPQLKVNKSSSVLDIGCGIGRWAESIIPEAGYYLGTDFSGEMIKIAQQRCSFENADYDFINVSFQEACRRSSEKLQRKFDRVVIGGVCMYINDADLKDCIAGLIDLLDEHCIMYLTETVAVETRLTLDECPSDALKTTYDVIYRTPSEYNAYSEVFKNAGFRIVKQDYLPHLNNEASFSETDRWYTILER